MFPRYHILFGLFFSIFLFLIFPKISLVGAFIIFLSSFLVDFDHYLTYVIKNKDFSLKRSYRYYLKMRKIFRKKFKKNPKLKFWVQPFHTVEFLLLIFIFSFFNIFLFYIFLGTLFHFFLDIIEMPFNKILGGREFSFIRYLISDKKNYL